MFMLSKDFLKVAAGSAIFALVLAHHTMPQLMVFGP
jgi:hypothetical protein